MENFKENLLRNIKPHDMSIVSMCRQAGISHQTAYRMFDNRYGTVSLDKYIKLANLFGVSVSEILNCGGEK